MARTPLLLRLSQGYAAFALTVSFTASALAQTLPTPPAPPSPPTPPATSTPSSGPSLDLAPSCLTDLHIRTGLTPSVLSGNAVLSSTGHDILELSLKDQSCDTDGSADIQVPEGTSLSFRGNETQITATGLLGNIRGFTANGDVEIEQARDVSLRMTGSGNVSINTLIGTVKIQNFSNGDLSIGSISSPKADLSATSSGDLLIKSGWVDALSIRNMSSSDITAHIRAKNAHVAVYGSGNVTVDHVSETLSKTHYGSGSLNVQTDPGARIDTTNTVDGNAIARDVLASVGSRLQNTDLSHSPTILNTHSSHHHSPLRLILTLVIIGLILRHARRYRQRTGQSFFANLWTNAVEGYASFVRNWEVRMRERRGEEAHIPVEPPHVHYTRRAVDLYQEVIHTAREQRQRHASRVRPATPDTVALSPALIRLNDRLARLEPRLARMEQFVTSPDFALERQFRDLERSA